MRSSTMAALLALICIACGDNPLAPFQPQLSNEIDSFELQATDVASVTSTVTYDWANTGTLANVDHSTVTTQGQARLVVRDAGGAIVYDKILTPSLNEATQPGLPGTWMVDLIMTDYSGTLNFRLQKP